MRRTLLLSTLLFAPLAVTGCISVEPGDKEAAALIDGALPDVPAEWQTAAESVRGEPVGWIEAFGDPALVALVEEAEAGNPNIAAAAASVEQARALAKQAGADLSPQVSLVAQTSESSGIGAFDDPGTTTVGAQFSWEADVWGRIRSGQQSATANFEAVQADYRFAKYSLAANVATAYFLSIEAVRQESITQGVVDALTETARIVDVRFDNGLASAQDKALTQSQLATAQDQLENIRGAKRNAFRALELLLGRYPSADVDLAEDLPEMPPLPPAGLPSDLLERRPDVISAERSIAASVDAVDAAEAARLPSFSLTGTVGESSTELQDIFSPTNLAWQLASNIAAPLIDGGRIKNQIAAESAELDAAVADYVAVALNAFSEVETGLDQSSVLVRRQERLAVAEDEAERALKLANLNYQEGETDLIDVLNIQQTVFDAQSNLLSVERTLRENYVQLNLALGGDWRSVPAEATTDAEEADGL